MRASSDWEVVLIGGGGGVGKTHVAKRLASRLGIDCLQADDVRLVLQRAVPPDLEPALHYFLAADIERVDLSEALAIQQEIGRYVSHKLEVIIAHHVATRSGLVIEGDAILPELALAGSHAGQPTAGRVRAVYLEETDAEHVHANLAGRGRGQASRQSERRWATFHHAHGLLLAARARELGVPVLAARPRRDLLARVTSALSAT